MSVECEYFPAAPSIPDLNFFVVIATDNAVPVGTETHIGDYSWVSLDLERHLASVTVPDPDFSPAAVVASADDLFPVGAETHAVDRSLMPLERALMFSGLSIPDLQRVVIATADDPFPVGAEPHAEDLL